MTFSSLLFIDMIHSGSLTRPHYKKILFQVDLVAVCLQMMIADNGDDMRMMMTCVRIRGRFGGGGGGLGVAVAPPPLRDSNPCQPKGSPLWYFLRNPFLTDRL